VRGTTVHARVNKKITRMIRRVLIALVFFVYKYINYDYKKRRGIEFKAPAISISI
jgi:hypothetical protein